MRPRLEARSALPSLWNVISDITAHLPANASRWNEAARHDAAPKILNLPFRVRTPFSNNNYWPRETDRQISLEMNNGAHLQNVVFKTAKFIWIKERGEKEEQQWGRSAGQQRDFCMHRNLKAAGKYFLKSLGVEVVCISWPSGSDSYFNRGKTLTVRDWQTSVEECSVNPVELD